MHNGNAIQMANQKLKFTTEITDIKSVNKKMDISKAFLVKVYLIYSTETKRQISKLQQKKNNIIWVTGKKALL